MLQETARELINTIFDPWDWIGRSGKYDRRITSTHVKMVRRFFRAERDFLDDVILKMTSSAVLVEIGCGTGRLVAQYLDIQTKIPPTREMEKKERISLINKIRYVIGIERSHNMAKRLEKNFKKYKIGNEKWKLIKEDAVNLDSYLPDIIQSKGLQNYSKVFCCMLSTLSNMDPTTRVTVLQKIKKIMNPGDVLVVTVWNKDFFQDGVEMYKKFIDVIGNLNTIDYSKGIITTVKNYYIEWFLRREIKMILKDIGFKNIQVSPKENVEFILVKATI